MQGSSTEVSYYRFIHGKNMIDNGTLHCNLDEEGQAIVCINKIEINSSLLIVYTKVSDPNSRLYCKELTFE